MTMRHPTPNERADRAAALRPWLDDVEFPARPLSLLATALRRPAPDSVVEHLGRLPDGTYRDVAEVSAARPDA